MSSTKLLLTAAKSLVEKGWTQGCAAPDSAGNEVFTSSKEACQFCTASAVVRACQDSGVSTYPILKEIIKVLSGQSIFAFNDSDNRTKQEILDVFDKAIANCG